MVHQVLKWVMVGLGGPRHAQFVDRVDIFPCNFQLLLNSVKIDLKDTESLLLNTTIQEMGACCILWVILWCFN